MKDIVNILVVDDDKPICENISRMIRNTQLNSLNVSKEVFSAYSVKDALTITAAQDIDIIFSDMKMPTSSGIDFLKTLNDIGFNGIFIVISGYDDYKLVRNSMKLGAEDYLLKPIDEKQFYETLNYAVKKCLNTNKKNKNSEKESVLKHIFFNQYILNNLFQNNFEVSEVKKYYNIDKMTKCRILVFEKEDKENLNEIETVQQIILILEAHSEHTFDNYVIGEIDQKIIVILLGTKNISLSNIKSKCMTQHNISVFHSNKSVNISNMNAQYNYEIDSLESMFYDDINNSTDQCAEIPNLYKDIVKHASEYDYTKFKNSLKKYLSLSKSNRIAVKKLKEDLINISYEIMELNNNFIKIINKYKFTDYDLTLAIQKSGSANSMYKQVSSIIHLYIKEINDISLNEDMNIKKAKEFIKQNYKNDISLTDVASHLDLHPNYLSTIFKNQTKKTYSQYLREIRVKESIKLMQNTKKKQYEIATLVGFNDSSHFYRAFKEVTGTIPSEYKKL